MFSLSKKICSGLKNPAKKVLNFENCSPGKRAAAKGIVSVDKLLMSPEELLVFVLTRYIYQIRIPHRHVTQFLAVWWHPQRSDCLPVYPWVFLKIYRLGQAENYVQFYMNFICMTVQPALDFSRKIMITGSKNPITMYRRTGNY